MSNVSISATRPEISRSEPLSPVRALAHSVGLRRFAKVTCGSTFLLVIAGSLVTTTGSGLAVPDWPLSFGQFFPPMVGGVLYEHGHRMIAGTVGILITVLAIWTLISEPRRWVRRLAVGAWIAVVIQAVLGGITVLYKLPLAVSVSHAGLAMAFFSATVALAIVMGKSWTISKSQTRGKTPAGLARFGTVTVLAVYAQIILGAVMRHMGAGLAIPDFPLAWGQMIPPLHTTSVAIHFAHRVGAVTVGALIAMLAWMVYRSAVANSPARKWAHSLAGLFVVQFMLGAWTIWSMKSLLVTTAHVATGALTLVVSVGLALWLSRFRNTHASDRSSEMALKQEAAV